MHEARLSNLRKALTQMVEKLMRLLDESRTNRTILNYLNRELHRLPILITLALHLTDNLLEQHGLTRCRLETSGGVTATATSTSQMQMPNSNNNERVWTVTTGTNTPATTEQPQLSTSSTSTETERTASTSFG